MGAEDLKRTSTGDDVTDTSEAAAGKRGQTPENVAENLGASVRSQNKRCRVGGRHVAFVAEKEVAKEHAQWWSPDLRSRLDATQSSAVDSAISAWVAEDGNRVLGQ